MNNSWRNLTLRQPQHKFRAKQVKHEGENFASKLEFAYKQHLDLRQKAGEVLFYLRQVPIHLMAGKYVCDFVVFYTNFNVEFIDVKGFMTEMCKLKIKQVETMYPINIKIIKKGDF